MCVCVCLLIAIIIIIIIIHNVYMMHTQTHTHIYLYTYTRYMHIIYTDITISTRKQNRTNELRKQHYTIDNKNTNNIFTIPMSLSTAIFQQQQQPSKLLVEQETITMHQNHIIQTIIICLFGANLVSFLFFLLSLFLSFFQLC